MFEETGTVNFHVDRIRGRVKLVTIQATFTGGTPTLDAANSSPGTAIAGAAGDYTLTLGTTGTFGQWVGALMQLAEATGVGATCNPEALSASAGTAAFETVTATAPGTAVSPADGSRVFITILIGRTG